jgi:DNA-binding SARP family transcriptional activator
VQVDVRDFIVAARQLLGRSPGGVSTLPAQLVSWGELLPGWYEDWVLLERDRIRQLRLHALEELADQLARRGQFSLALEAALNAVNAEPLRESAHRSVARVHLAEGNPAEAVHQYETFRCMIGDELGLSPTQKL